MDPARGIIVDSSLLVLLVVGGVSPQMIGEYKRTRQYEASDFHLIADYLSRFRKVFTTPHIATETANLIGALKGQHLRTARAVLGRAIGTWLEIYEPTQVLAVSPHYLTLGLADAGIVHCAEEHATQVLTDDLGLHITLQRLGIPSINYSHWRGARWFQE